MRAFFRGEHYHPQYTHPHVYTDGYRWTFKGPILADKITVDEDDANFTISIILPGYEKNDIQISAFKESVKVRVNAPQVRDAKRPVVATKSIKQIINLNYPLQVTKVSSEYVNGVLTITAPKLVPAAAQGRPVPVE